MFYLLLGFFFISGACGLVYEVVWSRQFVLVLGGTTHAITAVVVAFMGGLGLGSLLGGRAVDRARMHPVLIYGILEGGIGLLALLVPLMLALAQPLLALAYQGLSDHPTVYSLVRFMVAALVLFPPTLMMGATLPVLVKATLSGRDHFGLTAGRLYAINTAGAVAGAALAGFVLLPALGGMASILVAAGSNLLICAAVIFFGGRLSKIGEVEGESWRPGAVVGLALAGLIAETKLAAGAASAFFKGIFSRGDRDESSEAGDGPSAISIALLAGYCLSGVAALIYQIAWTRSLTLTLGGSTYTFSLILTAYIGGLALGGALMTPLADRLGRPLLVAGLLEFGIGLAAMAVLPFLDNVNHYMYHWVYEYKWGGSTLSLIRFGVTFGMVVAPTMIMGALLPLVARLAARESTGVGEPMGRVYAANTLGAIGGAFLAGYVLIDLVGVRGAIFIATLVSLLVGSAWVLMSELSRRASILACVLTLLIGVTVIRTLPPADPILLNSGPYIYAGKVVPGLGRDESVRDYLHRVYRLNYFKEDAETTVSVMEERIDEWRVLRINGKTDASSLGDMPNQVLLAHFPLLVHPNPKKVMVLGLASGVTAGSALLHPIESLDCLELSPAVVEASHYFDHVNNLDYDDPRFHLILNDGRNHLALGADKYDAIISEPSNPWQAAMSAMFTSEFFEQARASLNPGGIAVVWIDLYDMNVDSLSLILRTFAAVFPHVTMWESLPGADYVLMGSNEPFRIDYQTLERRVQDPRIRADLSRIQSNLAEGFLARFVMDGPVIREIVGDGPLHTDDLRQLEFEMPKHAFTGYTLRLPAIYRQVLGRHVPATGVVEPPPGPRGQEILEGLKRADEFRHELFRYEAMNGDPAVERELLLETGEQLLAWIGPRYPAKPLKETLSQHMGREALSLARHGETEAAVTMFKRAHELTPRQSRIASSIAKLLLGMGDYDGARQWAEVALKAKPKDRFALLVLSKLAAARGEFAEEEAYLRGALEVSPIDLTTRLTLARSLVNQGKFEAAVELLEELIEDRPRNSDARFFMGLARRGSGDLAGAHESFSKCMELDPEHPSRTRILKMLYELESARN